MLAASPFLSGKSEEQEIILVWPKEHLCNEFILLTTKNTYTHVKIYVHNVYKMMIEISDMMDNSGLHPHFSNLSDRVTHLA